MTSLESVFWGFIVMLMTCKILKPDCIAPVNFTGGGSCGLAEGCGFESQVRQGLLVGGVSSFNTTTEVSLSKAPNPQLLPGRCNMAAHCSGCVFT